MYIYVCLVIIILLSLIYLMVAKGIKNKKRIVLISTIAIILIGFMSVIFIKFSNNEEYIKINENNKEVSIKLKIIKNIMDINSIGLVVSSQKQK